MLDSAGVSLSCSSRNQSAFSGGVADVASTFITFQNLSLDKQAVEIINEFRPKKNGKMKKLFLVNDSRYVDVARHMIQNMITKLFFFLYGSSTSSVHSPTARVPDTIRFLKNNTV